MRENTDQKTLNIDTFDSVVMIHSWFCYSIKTPNSCKTLTKLRSNQQHTAQNVKVTIVLSYRRKTCMKAEEAVLPSLSAMSLLIRSRFACRLLRVNSLCCSPECEKGNTRIKYGRSRPEVFCKNGVLRNFTKFTGKHLCQSPFFNKVTGLRLQLY